MARRYLMTPRRRVALRKAQVASAKKRRSRNRKIAVGVLAGGTAMAVMKYRKYDRAQEANQSLYLEAVANNALWKAGIHGGGGEEYTHSMRVPLQPRRYRNRPKSQQTKLSIAQSRKGIFGKAVNSLDRAVTSPAPIRIRTTSRKFDVRQSGPRFKKTKLTSATIYGVRTGKRRVSVTVDFPRSKRKKR